MSVNDSRVDSKAGFGDADRLIDLWNKPQVRALAYQILVVGGVVLLLAYLAGNVIENREARGIAGGFGFLEREAGFAINDTLIPYSPSDTYGTAFLVGVLNTLRVALLGIVLATVLGTIIGIARLSSNFLVATLSSWYVEVTRNVPLLLQLFIWASVLRTSMPSPRQAFEPLPGVFISNRGVKLPVPEAHPVWDWMLLAAAIGILAAWIFSRWAKKQQDATGKQYPTFWVGLGCIAGLPFLTWLVGGAPTQLDMPELRGFNFRGGLTMTPEFFALLLGLTIYTAGFIAEIVRSGILAVSYGQTEAAASLGLRRGLVLRLVVLPQALRVIIPPTTSQYLNLTKNSSLAVGIGYFDMVNVGNTTMNQTGQAVEAIAMFMAVYLTISLTISLLMNWYNRQIALVER